MIHYFGKVFMHRFAALVLLCFVVGCDSAGGKPSSAGSASSAAANGSVAGAAQPAKSDVKLDLKTVDEVKALIASKKGKVVVMDAWSTYCDPCMKEFPGLVALHKKYGPEKLACISLCVNYVEGVTKVDEEVEPIMEFLTKMGATFDNVLATETDELVYKKLDFPSVPAIFIYDRDGKLVKLINTETTYAEVEKIVAPLLQ